MRYRNWGLGMTAVSGNSQLMMSYASRPRRNSRCYFSGFSIENGTLG
jgi:hypothetical protein